MSGSRPGRVEDVFQTLFKASPVAMILASDSGRIIMANPQAETLFGYQGGELLGQEVEILLPERLRADHRGLREGLPRLGGARSMGAGRHLLGRRKDGGEVPIEIGLTPVETPAGPAVLASIIDISVRLRADKAERLERSNEDLEAFIRAVSHDLHAPLRRIHQYAAILEESLGRSLSETDRGYLRRLQAGAETMARLVEALLRLSRGAAKPLVREKVDLSALAEGLLDELRHGAPERKVACRVEPGLSVDGDAVLLRSALGNLLSNAWKYTAGREDARIEVGASTGPGGQRVYSVRDNGAGFDMARAGLLFEPFQRLHEQVAGIGLGLTTTRRIIERHGGRIWAEAAPSRGATFYFIIPSP